MARGIMADKGNKVASSTSEHSESKNQTSLEPFNNPAATTAPCSCTKISTMQLFYEMKQKFPTVPDNVVCEFVGQNCHNRSACIDGLEDYPNSANVYPQALRNQPNKKKSQNINRLSMTTDKQIQAKIIDDTKDRYENQPTSSNELSVPVKPSPPPSNTLNLTNLNCCTRPVSRPTRVAPPPPPPTNTTHHNKSLPNQPLNLSVNVIVSPVSRPPKSQQSHSHFSFTLHQPNSKTGSTATHLTGPQSQNQPTTTNVSHPNRMDVPSLKYTSSAYDAEIGYQSRLEITVAGASPKTMKDNANQLTEDAIASDGNNISLRRSCEITENNLPSVVASSEFLEETETVHHQILCKQKLVLELEKDRKRLERMQRELQAIQAPLPDGGLGVLSIEIEKLRNDCKVMAQYVEEAGPSYALGETNEAFYRNIYTGQQLPMQQRQTLRPHRSAPVPDFRHMQNHPSTHTNIAGVDPRFIPTTPITQSPLNPNFNESNEDAGWICDVCTFQNKYTQQSCEACTMPFLSAGNQMGYNNGSYVQQLPPYPLTHYMPMPMPMSMPMPMLSLPYTHNNNNNMPYIYYQASSLPPQFYPTPTSTPTPPPPPMANSQSMHSRF